MYLDCYCPDKCNITNEIKMILILNKVYSPDVGGVETVVRQYAELFVKREQVVVVCACSKATLWTRNEKINGVHVVRCSSLGTLMSMPISFTFLVYAFFYSRKARIVSIHEPNPLATLAGFLIKRSKIVATWHSDIVNKGVAGSFFCFLQKHLYKSCRLVIVTSKKLLEHSSVLNSSFCNTIQIPLGVNLGDYSGDFPLSSLKDREYSLPDKYALYIGRFSHYKGIDFLLDSIEFVDPAVQIVLVGDGPLAVSVEKRTKSMPNVLLINRFVSEEEKKVLIGNARMLLFPSILPSEAFGIVQLEAMALGTPVINTMLDSGVPWVSVNNISGITVRVEDQSELAEAINTIYLSDSTYSRLSHGAKERVKELFDQNKIDEKLLKCFFDM